MGAQVRFLPDAADHRARAVGLVLVQAALVAPGGVDLVSAVALLESGGFAYVAGRGDGVARHLAPWRRGASGGASGP